MNKKSDKSKPKVSPFDWKGKSSAFIKDKAFTKINGKPGPIDTTTKTNYINNLFAKADRKTKSI